MTPEGRTKEKIRKVFDKYKNDGSLYKYMPVPFGYGEQTIDCLGCFCGLFFGIEAKAPGKRPTELQERTLKRIRKAGGKTFVIDGTDDTDTIDDLDHWFSTVVKEQK